jgi:hypothetical protein
VEQLTAAGVTIVDESISAWSGGDRPLDRLRPTPNDESGTVAERSVPYTPGSSSRLQSRSYSASMAFAPIRKAQLSPPPSRRFPTKSPVCYRSPLSAGEQVVVLGVGGLVGQAAVRLARLHGVPPGGRRRPLPRARQRAAEAGADAVVALASEDVPALVARFADALDGPADL